MYTRRLRGHMHPRDRTAMLHAGWQQVFPNRAFPAAELNYTAQGQPYLPGEEFSVSFSHADGLSVLACGTTVPIGADLVHLQDAALAAQLDASFFTPREHLALAQQRTTPLRLWSRKEAVLKAAGVGLLIDPQQAEVANESSFVLGKKFLLYSTILTTQYELALAVDWTGLEVEPLEVEYKKIEEHSPQ